MAQETTNEIVTRHSVDKTAPTTLPDRSATPKPLRIGKAITPKRYTVRAPRTQLNKPIQPKKVKKSKIHKITWKRESSTLQLAQAPYVKLDKTQFDTLLRTLRKSKKRAEVSKTNSNSKSDETAMQMVLPSRPAGEAKHQECNAEPSSTSPLQGIVESAPSETPYPVSTEAQETQTSPSLFRNGNLSESDKSPEKTAEVEPVSDEVEELAEDFDQSLGIDMVDIYVGQTQRHFRIHKKLLCNRIPFFSKMFNGPFQEARTSTATLPEDNADAFALLVEWVYKGTFQVFNLSNTTYEVRKSEIENPKFLALFRLYGLAGKYLVHSLMDYVMSLQLCYWEKARCTPALNLIELIFRDSWAPPNSPCRRYLAKWLHYYYVCPENRREEYRREPYTVAQLADTAAVDPEMARLFMEHLRGKDWALFDEENEFVQFDYCEFHMHPEEEDKQCLYTRVRIQQPTVKALSAWWEQEI